MNTGSVISAMIDYLHGNLHEVEHMLKVYGYARTIGEMEGLDPRTQYVLEVAAAVHDIGIPRAIEKYGDDAGPHEEELGPAEAQKLLEGLGCDAETIDRVCYLVGHHHSYGHVDGTDYRILLEADFLVNADEGGLVRAAIENMRQSVFRTGAGVRLLDSIYLREQ